MNFHPVEHFHVHFEQVLMSQRGLLVGVRKMKGEKNEFEEAVHCPVDISHCNSENVVPEQRINSSSTKGS